MADLDAGKRDVAYPIADGGKLKRYRLFEAGREPLETKVGHFETIIIKRERRSGKRETRFWCAPALGFLPVKIEHKERDGTLIVLEIDEVSFPAPDEAPPASVGG